jgi:hypothetical protein
LALHGVVQWLFLFLCPLFSRSCLALDVQHGFLFHGWRSLCFQGLFWTWSLLGSVCTRLRNKRWAGPGGAHSAPLLCWTCPWRCTLCVSYTLCGRGPSTAPGAARLWIAWVWESEQSQPMRRICLKPFTTISLPPPHHKNTRELVRLNSYPASPIIPCASGNITCQPQFIDCSLVLPVKLRAFFFPPELQPW